MTGEAKSELVQARRGAPGPGAGRVTAGWRAPLGALWRELSLSSATARRDQDGALRRAGEALDLSRGRLEAMLEPGRPPSSSDFERCLTCAAVVLEGCARLPLAYAAGSRRGHLHLLRRLEQRLERTERAVLRADDDHHVRRERLAAAAERGALALEDLSRCGSDSSAADVEDALGALEDGSVTLAALAIRAALNVRDGRGISGASDPPAQLLDALAAEVDALAESAAARRADSQRAGRAAAASNWLSEALTTKLPPTAVGRAPRPEASAALRAQTLGELRCAWLGLGARELLLLEELDAAAKVPVFGNPAALHETLAERAALLVHRTQISERAARFDHRGAWRRQHEQLAAAATHMRRPTRSVATARMAGLTVLSALERSAAALWTIDTQLDRTTPAANNGGITP